MNDMAEPAGDGHDALEQAALSDVGLRRANNQDSYTVALAGDNQDWRRRGQLFMVADGMGAHAAGELASKLACEHVPHTYRKMLDRTPADALRQAILAANTNIHERGQANAEFQGMGTTCTALVLMPSKAIIGHIGDSRVYRLRGTQLDQLTFDHSLVWEMMAAGQMPHGEVASFIPKNIITRSLGPHAVAQVDLEGPFELEPGDTFLLCSDGLTGQVKDEEIGAILSVLSPSEAVRVLVDMANLRGGPDNITVLVVRVASVPSEPVVQPEPTPVANNSVRPTVHPAAWGIMAISLLAAVGLAISDNMLPALAAGVVAAMAAVAALMQSLLRSHASDESDLAGPLGTGPHSTRDCTPDAELAAVFAQMAQQLREAAKDEHWTLDWGRFNAYGEHAQAAVAAKDFSRAVREHALAISFMMSEIRHQPARKQPRDNSVLDL